MDRWIDTIDEAAAEQFLLSAENQGSPRIEKHNTITTIRTLECSLAKELIRGHNKGCPHENRSTAEQHKDSKVLNMEPSTNKAAEKPNA